MPAQKSTETTAWQRRLLICSLVMICSWQVAYADEVRVAVASNFKSVLIELEAPFEQATGHDLIISSGSTGKQYAQIINHAPFHVFLAADQVRPMLLEQAGHAREGQRFTYAIGQLVLLSADGTATSHEDLHSDELRHVAIANPALAPYGLAAEQVIAREGLDAGLASKLVYGENVGQAYGFVATGAAELGFVSLSQVLSQSGFDADLFWKPDPAAYDPIKQDAVLLKRGEDNPAALAFISYLKSDGARNVIARSGYVLP